MSEQKPTNRPWIRYNHLTRTYDTRDGTGVSEELADNVECLSDVLHIARIRSGQREEALRRIG